MIGVRGDWWPKYAVMIDDSDRILSSQTGGFNQTLFGERLKTQYGEKGAFQLSMNDGYEAQEHIRT